MIPAFDHNGVLPPFLADPTQSGNMAPYASDTVEICRLWGGDTSRRAILRGFLKLRADLAAIGLTQGMQWLDGSFVEDCEKQRGVPPGDIDVITFFAPYTPTAQFSVSLATVLGSQPLSKATYRVDHILIPLALQPVHLVNATRFWYGLFSHRKVDSVWKGMLQVPLISQAEDADALALLDTFETP